MSKLSDIAFTIKIEAILERLVIQAHLAYMQAVAAGKDIG